MELTTLCGNSVSRLGFASQYLRESTCVATAFYASINYFFFYNLSSKQFLDELKHLLVNRREALFISTGSEHRNLEALNRDLDQVRQTLNIDVVDAFFAEYLSPRDEPSDILAMLNTLRAWKEKGRIRYVGVSTHNPYQKPCVKAPGFRHGDETHLAILIAVFTHPGKIELK